MPDFVVALVVSGAAFVYAVGVRSLWATVGPYHLVSRTQACAFGVAIVGLVIAVVSPLDAAGDQDLVMHMAQHVLLLAVIPPLLAVSAPITVGLYALPGAWRRRLQPWSRRVLRSQSSNTGWFAWMAGAFVLSTVALGIWHLPALYDAAVAHDSIHIVEHVSFVATATLFWWMALGGGRRSRRGPGVLAVFVATLPATALGVLMTLASTSWYAPYGRGARAVRDQQVAGAVMWGYGGSALIVAAAALFAGWMLAMERADERSRARGALEQW